MDAEVTASIRRLTDDLQGQYAIMMLGLGMRIGLLDALRKGPADAAELATRAGTHERSTREWLAMMTAAGYLRHAAGTFRLRDGFDALLDPATAPLDLAVLLQMGPLAHKVMPELELSMRDGRGVPYSRYDPAEQMQDRMTGPLYDRVLVNEWVPAVAGLGDLLRDGVRAADLGCGAGRAVLLLAGAFPASTFVGYDQEPNALAYAARRAAERGLSNVEFRSQDLQQPVSERFHVVFAIDTVHDLPDPVGALRVARTMLRPGGVLVLVEPEASGDVDVDTAHPQAVQRYFSSVFHCMQVSLAAGGPGLGNRWGTDAVVETLRQAGFGQVDAHATTTGQTIFQARED
ncbi:MAG: methyltransferase domain-containing protein [Actinocatenispora sp.]